MKTKTATNNLIRYANYLAVKYSQDWATIVKHPSLYPNYVKDPKNWAQLRKDWEKFKERATPKSPQNNTQEVIQLDMSELQKTINSIIEPNKFAVAGVTGQLINNSIAYMYISLMASNNDAMYKIQSINKIIEDLERIYAINGTPVKGADGKVYGTQSMKTVPGAHINIIDFN
jgi:hypothetical protein